MKPYRHRSTRAACTLAALITMGARLLLAQNQTVNGNLTVTGTIGSAGAIDSDSNTFSFGTQGASFGAALLYQDADVDTFIFSNNRTPASWLWQHLTGVAAMRLDASHQLVLYQSNGTTAGITLTPASNQLSLGTATLTASGTAISTNGSFTIAGGITNTNGSIMGGASGLTLNAGGTDQNITLTPSGAGKTIVNGNLLLGTATDSGNGRLQLATHTTNAGGIGFGLEAANTIYRTGVANLRTNAQWQVADTTASTSATTGSGTFAGGVGVGGALWVGTGVTSKSTNGTAMFTGWQWGTTYASSNPIFDGVTDNATAGTNYLLGSKRTGDTGRRFVVSMDGLITWGAGGASDTNLYRSSAGVLKTDGTMAVGVLSLGAGTPSAISTNGSGNIALTAAGTNQGIALMPSGTGVVSVNQPSNNLALVNVLGLSSYSTPASAWYGGTRPLLSALSEGASGTGDLNFGMANGTNARSSIVFRRAEGTLAAPTAVLNGDLTGSVIFSGYDGSAFVNSTAIVGVTDSTYKAIGTGAVPQRMEFQVGIDGSASRIGAMFLKANGGLQLSPANKTIPSWGTAGAALQVTGTTVTDSTATSGTISSAVMSSFGVPTFAFASAQTLTSGATVYIGGDPILGANGTLGTGALVGLRNVGKTQLDANVGIKASPKPNVSLYVTGQPGYSGGTSVGVGNTVVSWDSAQLTSSGIMYDAYFTMAAGTSTVPNIYAFNANGGVNDAGVTITNYTAFNTGSTPSGGTITNLKAFRGGYAAGTGRWNLYMDGTAANLLAGQTSITNATASTSAATGALVVTGGVGVGGDLNVTGTIKSTGSNPTTFSGNVGIGTAAPSTHLHVDGAGDQEISISSSDSGGRRWTLQSSGASSNVGKFQIIDRTAVASRLSIDAAGNVGIGTTTPASKLEVAGDVQATNLVEKKLSFVPNATGWWRVLNFGGQFAAGTVRIYAANQISGEYVEHELQISIPGYGQTGTLIQTRGPTYNAGQEPIITAARISNSGASCYLDLYVRAFSATEPIVLFGYGPKMPAFVTPTSGATAGSAPLQIALTAGITTNGFKLTEAVTNGQTFGNLLFGNWDTNSYQYPAQIRAVALTTPSSGYAPSALAFYTGFNNVPTERVRITDSGNVGIGTTNPTQKLSVNGTIRAKEIIVDTGWADYVFEDSYRLAPLSEVEAHIKSERHLPGVPSAQEVAEHGVSMGEMQSKLLSKIEELTLHLIEQEKKLAAQSARIEQLEREATSRNR